MRKLNETELFGKHLSSSEQLNMVKVMESKLFQGEGVIAPEHIEAELIQLKVKSKKSPGLLGDAISLYENFNGRIRLFNLGTSSGGKPPIPPYIPFLVGNARNRSNDSVAPAVYMNLYRIGRWSVDESTYNGLSVPTDLFSILESGIIAYKLIVESNAKKLFSNTTVLEQLSFIYANLFASAVIKTMNVFGDDFNTDAAYYLIAKFFLRYVLKLTESQTLNDIARGSIRNRTSLKGLETFEENNPVRYDSLSGFLEDFGNAFFNKAIELNKFVINWLSLTGEGLLMALEYVPFFIHYIFATYHGAMLGGSTRLKGQLEKGTMKMNLVRLYNNVIAELR